MITTEFDSFESMQQVARKVSSHFHVSVTVARTQSGYRIVPDELLAENLQQFAKYVYLFGGLNEAMLGLLQYVNTQHFQSSDLIWRDPETGLAWDVSRTISQGTSDHPQARLHILNKIRYGGRDNWRLPTLMELGTLSMKKLVMTRAGAFAPSKSLKLWACEESLYSGPEKALWDLVTQRRFDQRFIEEHKDRSGGRYTESAKTMVVSSSD
jgi:hypothetical protein